MPYALGEGGMSGDEQHAQQDRGPDRGNPRPFRWRDSASFPRFLSSWVAHRTSLEYPIVTAMVSSPTLRDVDALLAFMPRLECLPHAVADLCGCSGGVL